MRTPEQVTSEIRTRYDNSWRDWLLEPPASPLAFSLTPPKAKRVASEPDVVGRWIRAWRTWSGTHPQAHMRAVSVKTDLGPQTVYTHVDLPTAEAVARIDADRSAHWQRATTRWQTLAELPGVTHAQLRPRLKAIIDLPDADFTILLASVQWFIENPRSGYTIRQVPVEGMHTKWLARHRRLVLACLNVTAGPTTASADETDDSSDDEIEQADLDPLGLRALPAHIDVILVDSQDRQALAGLRHLRAPIPEIAALPLRPRVVLIIENKESAYLVPDEPGVVVLHSLGNHLNALPDLPWLEGARCIYWGDLDRAGITLLSRARAHLPELESILMDPGTFHRYEHLAVPDTTRADPPADTLTEEEIAAHALLSNVGGHARLEQERLSAPYVLATLTSAIRT